MKSVSFIATNRKIIRFDVVGRRVILFNDLWKEGIQIYPLDKKLVKSLIKSKDKAVSAQGLLIAEANLGKNLKEYKACETEDELIMMIKSDCKKKGLLEVK